MNANQKKLAKAWSKFYCLFAEVLGKNPAIGDLLLAAVDMFKVVDSDPSLLTDPLLKEAIDAGLAAAQKTMGKQAAKKRARGKTGQKRSTK